MAMSRIWVIRLILLLSVISSLATLAFAVDYFVGDYNGWSESNDVDYNSWVDTKTFYVGDALVFYYREGYHTVVEVNESGYTHCRVMPYLGMLASGYDIVVLDSPGNRYFICGVDDHCSYYNQRLKITVHSRNTTAPVTPPLMSQQAAASPPPRLFR